MSGDGAPIVVLFVDDEDAVLRLVRRVLAKSDLDVRTASSGAAALELLRATPVDVLVSDIDMPGMNGLELLRVVRREQPDVVRMLLTGAATLDRALAAINDGEVARFFTKPFDLDAFRAAMNALAERIARSRGERAEAARRARAAELQAWLDERYPGLLELRRGPDGAIALDAGVLADALAAPELAAIRALLDGDD